MKTKPSRLLAPFFFFLTLALLLSSCSGSEPKNNQPDKPKPTPVESTRQPDASDKRPNVVLMLVDDMRTEDLAYMPKLQKYMADKGISFPNMISTNPLCCPARAALLTGQYTHNNGVLTNKGPYGGIHALIDPENTLPVWLKKAGYNTAFFGKYLNGYSKDLGDYIPAGWDWWDATRKNTYAFTRFEFMNNGNPEYFTKDYVTTKLRERSDEKIVEFSQQREETGEPFFIFDSYVAPHSAINATKYWAKRYPHAPIPEKKYLDLYLDEVNPSLKKPSFGVNIINKPDRVLTRNERKFTRKFKTQQRENSQRVFLARIQSLASVDDAVEQTVKTLKETGQYDNTVLMFLSDNGYLLGEHNLFGKRVGHQESVSVPLVVSGGPFAGGEVSQRWATTQDVVATIVKLADAYPGRPMDGVSLIGSSGKDAAPTELMLIENGNDLAKSTNDPEYQYQGLLAGDRYTYLQKVHPVPFEELYDRKNDPYELVNVAQDPAYAEVMNVLRKSLEEMKDCSGVGACYAEVNLPKVAVEPQKRSSKRR